MNVSGKTKVCGLIGDPVDHSLSPCLQNAAFRNCGLDIVYVAFRVERGKLEAAIDGVRSLGMLGLNVTMPHKVDVVQYLDELDEATKCIGSVNTILNQGGRLIGSTTDGKGALETLRYNGVEPKGKKVVILGAGGVSRSISCTLAKEAKELVILNRTLGKAEELVKDLGAMPSVTASAEAAELTDRNAQRELRDADILINATSMGMHPQEELTPVDPSLLRPGLVIFDLVYEPFETRLLAEAKKRGAKVIDGLTMLVFQGAVSFETWTGVEAPVEVMMKAAAEEVARRKGGEP